MIDELESKLNELETEIEALPGEKKRAVIWVIENFDLAMEMCGNSSFSDEEIQRRKEEAAEKEEHLRRALLCLCQALRKEEERERCAGKEAEDAPKERV